MVNAKNEYKPDFVPPPGDTLREVLELRGMSQTELAERIGQSRKNVSEILQGQAPITSETALRLERTLGVSARFWSSREQHYREHLARKAEQEALEKQAKWLKRFPVAAMVRMRWLELVTDMAGQLRALLEYFEVATPEAWEDRWSRMQAAFRKPTSLKTDRYALAAWLRQGEIIAQGTPCADYDASAFRMTLHRIRSLTLEPPEVFQNELVKQCAACGVAVAFIPELPNTASGATRWLSSDKALIQLSLRYKTDDHLWFTFFHEAAHILLHGKRQVFVEGEESTDQEEREADEFACNMLIPKRPFGKFIALGTFSKAAIRSFAGDQGIAPGIVVGRLQHDGLLPFSHCNDLKRKLAWA